MMAMSALSSFMSVKEQKNQANKQQSLMTQQAALQEQVAQKSYELDSKVLDQKEVETKQEESVETFERVRQSAKEASAMRLASSEAGVFGTSLFRMMASSQIQEAHDVGIIKTNAANELGQIGNEREAVQMEKEGRLSDASLKRKEAKLVKAPGGLSSALQIGTSGMKGFSTGFSLGSDIKHAIK
jgi:hypothetical protein